MAITFFSVNGAGFTGGGGGTVNTGNGISGDGSVGTPVILGGLLDQATIIDLNGFGLFINGTGVSTVFDPSFETSVLNGTSESVVQTSAASGLAQLISFDSDLLFSARIATQSVPASSVKLLFVLTDTGTGFFKSVVLESGVLGISVNDTIDNIGFVGTADYSTAVLASPGGLAYPQLITVQNLINNTSVRTLGTWDLLALSTTQVVKTLAVPAGHSVLYRMNYSLGYISGVANVQISLQYTDIRGNAINQNIALGLIGLGNIAANGYPTVFKPAPGTNVTVTVTVSGVISFDTSGSIEQLFSI